MGGHRSKWGKPIAYIYIVGQFLIFVNIFNLFPTMLINTFEPYINFEVQEKDRFVDFNKTIKLHELVPSLSLFFLFLGQDKV